MTRVRLDAGYDYNFSLLGIVSSEKGYRICWLLNSLLDIQLSAIDDHNTGKDNYSLFYFNNNAMIREYYLVANKGLSGKILVEEQRHADFFLLIRGDIPQKEKGEWTEVLKKQNMITMVFPIDISTIPKSKQNLLFS